jgi:hypothetical protein
MTDQTQDINTDYKNPSEAIDALADYAIMLTSYLIEKKQIDGDKFLSSLDAFAEARNLERKPDATALLLRISHQIGKTQQVRAFRDLKHEGEG